MTKYLGIWGIATYLRQLSIAAQHQLWQHTSKHRAWWYNFEHHAPHHGETYCCIEHDDIPLSVVLQISVSSMAVHFFLQAWQYSIGFEHSDTTTASSTS